VCRRRSAGQQNDGSRAARLFPRAWASPSRERRIASDYRTRGSAHRLRIMRVIDDADLRLNGATGEAPAAGRSGEHRGDEFAAATDADLVEYRLEVILNGVFGDVQRGRDNAGRGSA